jgi:hypothetical protein
MLTLPLLLFSNANVPLGVTRRKAQSTLPLTNVQNVQFFGDVLIGSPPQRLTMVFDTGSGQFVVRGDICSDCSDSESSTGYNPQKSSTSRASDLTYQTTYLSGRSQGRMVRDKISVGGFEAPSVLIAVAEVESRAFQNFKFDGTHHRILCTFSLTCCIRCRHFWLGVDGGASSQE